jgi:hypothetical protein
VYERNRQPPFRIRHWEKPTLERMLARHPKLIPRHGIISEEMRTLAEILAAEQEYYDKVWYVRKLILDEKIERGEQRLMTSEIADQRDASHRGALRAGQRWTLGRLGLGLCEREACHPSLVSTATEI